VAALEGLSGASQWLLDTLRGWRRRSRGHHLLAGLHERMPRDIGSPAPTRSIRAASRFAEQQAVLEGVIHMQTTSMQTPVPRDGTLLRTARAVGRWFSRAVNAIGQPYAKPEADHWADWPHFPPF
jgi:hypothetical protein